MNSTTKTKNFSTLGFIMSSIGAAVGLGNIWRFPKEMVASGGSSFILIYIIVLILIAFPVILLEMQYGLFFKKGVVSCFKNVGRRIGTYFGWKQVIIVGFVCVYYLVVLCWVVVGFANSLISSLFESWGITKTYFDDKILQLPKSPSKIGFSYWTLIAFIGLIILLVIVVSLGIKRGLEKINIFLVPGLFFLLIGLTIYALTDSKAIYGLKKLFEFKKKSFGSPFVWYKASIQAMFSVGIMFGTFIVLSKSANIKMDKGNDALIIIASDSFIGILSGILITTTIASSFEGNGTQISNQLDEFFKNSESGGSALVFEQLPKVFYGFSSKWLGQLLFIFFIISLLFAAFSSVIVLLEVFTDSVVEQFPQISRKKAIIFWGFFAFLQYLVYAVYNQKTMVDEQDKWINQLVLFVGIFEMILLVLYKGYKNIIKKNEQYTYLKMSKFNWLKKLILFITLPLTILLTLFGFIKLFNIDYFIFKNPSDNIKTMFNMGNLDQQEIINQWTSPERLFTIGIIVFIFIIPLLLTLITNNTNNKVKK